MSVGLTKEMMDAGPGGTGFSFVDLMADRAGVLFADAAIRNSESARRTQLRISRGVKIDDFFPEIEGLPEGLSGSVFQDEYGGLGGEKTRIVGDEIDRRLGACEGLAPDQNFREFSRSIVRITQSFRGFSKNPRRAPATLGSL